MRFVDAYGTKAWGSPKINLDHVARLDPILRQDDGGARFVDGYRCISASGEDLGSIGAYVCPTEYDVIVPNTGDSHRMEYALVDDELEVWRVPVLAWGIRDREVTAITYGWCQDADNAMYCVESAGLFTFPEEATFRNETEAREYAFTCLKRRREYASACQEKRPSP